MRSAISDPSFSATRMSVDKRSHAAAMPPTCDSDLCMCDSTVPIPHLLPSVNFFPQCSLLFLLPSHAPFPLSTPTPYPSLSTLPSFGPESGCGGTAACLATLACHPSFRSCLVSGFGGVLQTPVARGKKTSSGTGGGGNAAAQSPTD